jgi:hypothetical protein
MSNETTGLGTLLPDRPAVREVPRSRRQCVRNFPTNFVATELVPEGMHLQGEIRRKGNPQPTFFHSTSAHLSLLIRCVDVSKVPFCLPNKKQAVRVQGKGHGKAPIVSSCVGRTAYRTRWSRGACPRAPFWTRRFACWVSTARYSVGFSFS